jgi:hypothetical protein
MVSGNSCKPRCGGRVYGPYSLEQMQGKIDTLFIVDAAHDKVAGFNFGPQTDTRIRKMWSRPVDHQGLEKKSVRRA